MQKTTHCPAPGTSLFFTKRPNPTVLAIFWLTLLTTGVSPLSAQTVSGAGTSSCEALVEAAERESKEAIDGYLSWAQGFISGYNWANPGRQQVRLDHSGLLHWLLQYCTSNKGDKYYQAVQAAITVHAR